MTVASFIPRSYGGGAVVAQLTQQMGPTDTAFTITPTTNWVQNNNAPLGTSGPFSVIIDRFTATVEKIVCSSINLTTGQVQVLERGADGTTPQTHIPNSNPSGVQTCWTSVEAQEANQAVSTLFGTTGPVPETNWALQWVSGEPQWTVLPTPVDTAVPSGEMYSTSTTNVSNNTNFFVPMNAINLSGGMTSSGNSLVVPTSGRYLVTGQAQINVTTDTVGVQAGAYSSTLGYEILGSTSLVTSAISGSPAGTFSKVLVCTAGEAFSLIIKAVSATSSSWPLDYVANGVTNWMTVTWLSL
jgi:hypothetical protein